MIPIEYYSLVYYIMLAIIVMSMAFPLILSDGMNIISVSKYNWLSVIVLIFTILFIGLRDPWASSIYLGDTGAYTKAFTNAVLPSFETSKDFGFDLFLYLCTRIMSIRWFYLLCATGYVLLPYLAFRKWFGSRAWMALLVYVSAMSFWAFGINGLRNGLAAAFFIYGVSFVKQPVKLAVWFVMSVSFHKSMLLPTAAFLMTLFVKNTKVLVWIWLSAIVVSFFFGNNLESFVSTLFDNMGLNDKRFDNLYADELDGLEMLRRFRWDFIIYSSIPIALGYYYIYKLNYNNSLFSKLLNTYIISNTIWVFMVYAAYTNRTAYLSWFIMPVILVFPLLHKMIVEKQTDWVFWIIAGSQVFTLLMFFK